MIISWEIEDDHGHRFEYEVELSVSGRYRAATPERPAEHAEVEIVAIRYGDGVVPADSYEEFGFGAGELEAVREEAETRSAEPDGCRCRGDHCQC